MGQNFCNRSKPADAWIGNIATAEHTHRTTHVSRPCHSRSVWFGVNHTLGCNINKSTLFLLQSFVCFYSPVCCLCRTTNWLCVCGFRWPETQYICWRECERATGWRAMWCVNNTHTANSSRLCVSGDETQLLDAALMTIAIHGNDSIHYLCHITCVACRMGLQCSQMPPNPRALMKTDRRRSLTAVATLFFHRWTWRIRKHGGGGGGGPYYVIGARFERVRTTHFVNIDCGPHEWRRRGDKRASNCDARGEWHPEHRAQSPCDDGSKWISPILSLFSRCRVRCGVFGRALKRLAWRLSDNVVCVLCDV